MALIASLTLGPEGLDDARVDLVKLKGVRVVDSLDALVEFVWVLPAVATPPNVSPFEIPSLSESLSSVCAYK